MAITQRTNRARTTVACATSRAEQHILHASVLAIALTVLLIQLFA